MKKCFKEDCCYFNVNFKNNCGSIMSEGCFIKITKNPKDCDFKVDHPEMIDEDEIYQSLSRKNPLLFLETNDEIQVYIHTSLITKAVILNLNGLQPSTRTFNKIQKHTRSAWVGWARRVKTAEWGDFKDVKKVKFIYPKI